VEGTRTGNWKLATPVGLNTTATFDDYEGFVCGSRVRVMGEDEVKSD